MNYIVSLINGDMERMNNLNVGVGFNLGYFVSTVQVWPMSWNLSLVLKTLEEKTVGFETKLGPLNILFLKTF